MGADWFWGILGSALLAVLAFVLGRVNLASTTKIERAEELRRRRVDTYAAFCVSVIEYRRAQLHRWFVGQDLGGSPEVVEQKQPEVAEDVRRSRSAAWGRFYEVVMICGDDSIVARAQVALDRTKAMKHSKTAEQLNALSDEVHDAVRQFAAFAGERVLAPDQTSPSPPRMWVGVAQTRLANGNPVDES